MNNLQYCKFANLLSFFLSKFVSMNNVVSIQLYFMFSWSDFEERGTKIYGRFWRDCVCVCIQYILLNFTRSLFCIFDTALIVWISYIYKTIINNNIIAWNWPELPHCDILVKETIYLIIIIIIVRPWSRQWKTEVLLLDACVSRDNIRVGECAASGIAKGWLPEEKSRNYLVFSSTTVSGKLGYSTFHKRWNRW